MPGYPAGDSSGIGADWGNPSWASAEARFLVVRLSSFRDVERSTPHQFLFREIRSAMPGAYIDFAFFAPGRRDAARSGAGLASARPGSDFDVVFISNSYTLELVNLVPWLKAAGLEPTRSSRDERRHSAIQAGRGIEASRETVPAVESDIGPGRSDAEAEPPRFEPMPQGGDPIVVLGGSNAMASSAIYDAASGDSFVDAAYFGEGEGHIGRLAVGLAEASRASAADRARALERIADDIAGFWPTAAKRRVFQAKAADQGYPAAPPPRFDGDEAGTVRLEITKGCPGFCSFCFEGWERKPYRELGLESILAEARALKRATGADSVELASYNFNAHSRVVDVIRGLHGIFLNVGFQSQRADMLAKVPGLVRFEMAAGKRSFTVGVEGVSARMRAYFAKELTEADLRKVLAELVERGAREIKLFYILSGYEEENDYAEFGDFVEWLSRVAATRRIGSLARIVFSAGPLIRMPFTPMAYERLILDRDAFAAVSSRVSKIATSAGFEFREPGPFDEFCLSQVLALPPDAVHPPAGPLPDGDAGSGFGLLLAMGSRRFVYDGSLTKGAWKFAKDWLETRDALGPGYLGEKPPDTSFPYEFIEPVVSRPVAYRRFLAARSRLEPGSCLGGDCDGCGACDPDELSAVTGHSLDAASSAAIDAVEALVAAKRKPHVARVRDWIPPELAAAGPEYIAAAFRRRLFRAAPSLADVIWTARDSFLRSDDGIARLPGAYGDTCVDILSSRPLEPAELAGAGFERIEALASPPEMIVEARFTGATVRIAAALISAFLNAEAITHTLSMSGGEASISVSTKGKKKRNVTSARIQPFVRESAAEGSRVAAGGPAVRSDALASGLSGEAAATMTCGAKPDLSGLVELARREGRAIELLVRWSEGEGLTPNR